MAHPDFTPATAAPFLPPNPPAAPVSNFSGPMIGMTHPSAGMPVHGPGAVPTSLYTASNTLGLGLDLDLDFYVFFSLSPASAPDFPSLWDETPFSF